MTSRTSKIANVLRLVDDLEIAEISRPDECCGFGGTFSVNEADVSAAMGRDRIADHTNAGSTVLASADMSCLMHLDGLIRREQNPLRVMHVAQILVGRQLEDRTVR